MDMKHWFSKYLPLVFESGGKNNTLPHSLVDVQYPNRVECLLLSTQRTLPFVLAEQYYQAVELAKEQSSSASGKKKRKKQTETFCSKAFKISWYTHKA